MTDCRFPSALRELLFMWQVMYLPQRPLVAPGPTLRQQLAYPAASASALSDTRAMHLLDRVGLAYLHHRVQGNFDETADWAGA